MATFNLTTTDTNSANRERVRLYKASAPTAVVDEYTYNPPHLGGHTWSFYGLIPSENYLWRWTEIDGAGNDIQTHGQMNFTVPAYGSVKSKATQYLTADTTPGVHSGLSFFIMDGTAGTDDWRTWKPILEKIGFGTQEPGIEYSYNIATGRVDLTNADGSPYEIQPGERWSASFENQVAPAPVVVRGLFSGIKFVTSNATLLASDFGKNLIQVDGAGTYLEVTLPPIASVAENTELIIKSGRGNHKCLAVVSQDANAIDWLEGNRSRFYMKPGESLKIYRQNVGGSGGVDTWQVIDTDGNFKHVGLIVSEYSPIGNVFNRVPATNALCDIFEDARLYEYVQKLTPGDEVVNFTARTGNELKYTLANGSGKFYVPDLSDLYLRASDGTRKAGDFLDMMLLDHKHRESIGSLPTPPYGQMGSPTSPLLIGKYDGTHVSFPDLTSSPIHPTSEDYLITGTDNRPKSAVVKMYILC